MFSLPRRALASLFAKVDLSKIITDHKATLKRRRSDGKDVYSLQDVFVFLCLPIIVGIIAYHQMTAIETKNYSTSISVFSIFGALLFSAQVAMFSLLRRSAPQELNQPDAEIEREQIQFEREILIEVNSSISYLIVLSCLSISLLLFLSALDLYNNFITGLVCTIYTHYFLTAVMLIKRSHALFDNSYKRL